MTIEVDSSIALITEDEYRTFAEVSDTNTNFDSEKAAIFINAASQMIKNWCGRNFLSAANQTEILDGDGTTSYMPKNQPVNGVSKIEIWDGQEWDELEAANYDYTYDDNEIYFTDGNLFSRGIKNYRVTYSSGYAQSDIPWDLKRACAQLVQRALKKADKKEGLSSESFGDATTSYDLGSLISPDIVAVLSMYRRHSFG